MENWKDINGYESYYRISDLGNVLSIRNKRPIIGSIGTNGYHSVILCVDNVKKTLMTHRLVIKHFVPNPENKKEANHKNGIKTDNRAVNLEWATPSENIKHAYSTGLIRPYKRKLGGDNHAAIPISCFDLNGKLVKTYPAVKVAANEVNQDCSNLVKCCKGKQKTCGGFKWAYA